MTNKKIVFWGAGVLCEQWLESGFDEYVDFIIDNDRNKVGTMVRGKKIISPEQIDDWEKYYIIIVSTYYSEISNQLHDMYGLILKK